MKLYKRDEFWTVKDMLSVLVMSTLGIGLVFWVLIRHDAPSYLEGLFIFLVVMVCHLTGNVSAHKRVIKTLMTEVSLLKQEQETTKT
jgi:hypothetical protein